MPTKEQTAQALANAHFALDEDLTHIFRVIEPDEINPLRPVKLLEICSSTPEMGISPVGFNADPARGIFHPSVIIEVSPAEYDRLQRGELTLPHKWTISEELFHVESSRRHAS